MGVKDKPVNIVEFLCFISVHQGLAEQSMAVLH